MLRIQDIKLKLKEDISAIKKEILKKLNIGEESLISYRIFKESIDARKKNDICFVYTVDVEVKDEQKVLKKLKNKNAIITPDIAYHYEIGRASCRERV